MPIRKVKGGYKVQGTKTVHPTRAKAQKQLAAIKILQSKSKKGKK